jgi:O-6-methylguanine DNA methyltransferase
MVTVLRRGRTVTLYWASVASPLGACEVIASERGVCWTGTPGAQRETGLAWLQQKLQAELLLEQKLTESLRQAADELERYFVGKLTAFSCPLDLHGTPFQLAVWRALQTIPYGETRSYSEIAQQIGRPAARRAVGAANGANPVAIIVPCHRVIGSDGALTGYGGGLSTKAWLLQHEMS